MKIVKLSAYLQNNVGDDLMVEILINRYRKVYFWGCRGLQKKTKKLEQELYFDSEDIYLRWGKLNRLINILTRSEKNVVFEKIFNYLEKKSICSVAIGGSIYRELKDQNLQERMKLEESKKTNNKPFYVIGANFGPFSSNEFKDAFHNYYSTCSGVTFRDKKSYDLFSDLPVINYAPDVVFNVPEGCVNDDNQHVLISVINLSERAHLKQYDFNYKNKIADICKYIIDIGKTPVLMSFCSFEGDEECIKDILSLLNDDYRKKIEAYFYNGDTDELLEMFRNANFVIATRFHAMVLGMRFSKPLYTISYELKMDNVLNETKSNAFCSISDISKLTPTEIFNQGIKVVNIDDYINNASKQFAQLDQFLNEV